MGHPPKHTVPSIPRYPLCVNTLGQPCPVIWVGRSLPGTGGAREPPEQGAAPPLPESPAGCGCERQVWAGEGCLEFVSRSRERQEQILIINNLAGWRLCRRREVNRQRPVAKWVQGECGQHGPLLPSVRGVSGTCGVPRRTFVLSGCQLAAGDGIFTAWRDIAGWCEEAVDATPRAPNCSPASYLSYEAAPILAGEAGDSFCPRQPTLGASPREQHQVQRMREKERSEHPWSAGGRMVHLQSLCQS